MTDDEFAALMAHAVAHGAAVGDITAGNLTRIMPTTPFADAFRFEMLGLAYVGVKELEGQLAECLSDDDRTAWRIRACDEVLRRIAIANITGLAAGPVH